MITACDSDNLELDTTSLSISLSRVEHSNYVIKKDL